MKGNDKFYEFWIDDVHPVTMYVIRNTSAEARKRRNRITWENIPKNKE